MMSIEGLKNWIIKYKLYHIPFWFGYHLMWLIINIGSFSKVNDYLFFSTTSIKFYFYVIFQMVGVYFNLYYLIPKFLYAGRNKIYILIVITTILICAAFVTSGYYVVAYVSERTFFEIFNLQPKQFLSIFLIQALPSTAASMTLAMSVKLGKNWLNAEKKRRNLEKENLETELKYLKSQINPHFLFNTINSIFALIHKNPDLASESLASFSDMLRYQLYECNDEKLEINKELKFLVNFIDLEKLRLDEKQIEIKLNIINEAINKQTIAPFILIPFIENAFKHVSKGKGQKNFIRICIVVNDHQLKLDVDNSISEDNDFVKDISESSGIGLKNVIRRLDLIYGERYELDINEVKNRFAVNLKIVW